MLFYLISVQPKIINVLIKPWDLLIDLECGASSNKVMGLIT